MKNTEILPTAMTASSELTRTCVRHRFDFLLET